MSNNLIIFDTTLRDGEQSPGASMTKDEKVRIGLALERLNVDVIEAGFAAASPGDFESIAAVASAVKNSRICSLARAVEHDIERAGASIAKAEAGRIHTFIATSPIHMQHKLRMQPEQVIERAIQAVKQARNLCDDVEFSCEDAGRSEIDFLCHIIEAAIAAGARTINIPDTVGYAIPDAFADTVSQLLNRIPNADQAIFSVHCHNDLGLAVANSLAAVRAGARQVECTINGLGERAGNASLEEVVMAVRTRQDLFKLDSKINSQHIVPASRLVSSITGFPVQPNKAIVGANAFAHESGIHQDGVLKHRETYEIMAAEDVGWSTNKMVLGKHSGRNAFNTRMEELGHHFDDKADLDEAFVRFKDLADRKHEIFDEDLQALISQVELSPEEERVRLLDLQVHCNLGNDPRHASLVLEVEGKRQVEMAEGDGPVDACFKAIEAIVKANASLLLYSVNALTGGTDSQGEVTVRLEKGGRIVNGQGADPDIVVASALAYIKAVNLLSSNAKASPQQTV